MTDWQELKRVDGCDVVVVGGGIVGALVAARCAREGRQTAVLEALEVAGGSTGHSAGLVLGGLAGYYSTAVARYGRDLAREIWKLTSEGQQRLIEAAEALDVPVQRSGSLAVAADDAEAEVLDESARLLREDGFDTWFGYSDPLNRGFRAALRSPNDVTLNAAELAQALLDGAAPPHPIAVHEATEVLRLEAEQDGVRVWARGRTVFCETCVVAVDGYAGLLNPYFATRVSAARSLTLATEPLSNRALERPCSAHYGTIYCRQLPDRRLLLGAWRKPDPAEAEPQGEAAQDAVTEGDALLEELNSFTARYFPEAQTRSIERWSGIAGFTSDGLPLVGRLPEVPAVCFALGLGGRGLALAPVVAERVTELALYGNDPGLLSAARLG